MSRRSSVSSSAGRAMSRKGSSSSSSMGDDFAGVCGVSATSTPVKHSPAPGQSAAARSPSHSPALSGGGGGGRDGGGGGGSGGQPATASGRNVQFTSNKKRGSSGSDGSAADASSKLLGSFLGQSAGSRRNRLLDLSLSEGAWTRDSLARLLEEEAEDVHLASTFRGGLGGGIVGGSLSPPRFSPSESVRHTCNTERVVRAMPVAATPGDSAGVGSRAGGDNVLFTGEGEEPGNLSPADVAAMMHRLEHGISMTAPPEQLFKFLFPNASRPNLAGAGTGVAKVGEAEPGGREGEEGAEGADTNTLHRDGSCPIVCFGSGLPDSSKPQTLLQLRGDAPPPWFPGYFMALPENGGILEVKHSPTEVMQAAYMAARPRNIPPDCRFVY